MDGEGNLKSKKCARMTGKTESKVISMCIVPVKAKHEDGKDTITT